MDMKFDELLEKITSFIKSEANTPNFRHHNLRHFNELIFLIL